MTPEAECERLRAELDIASCIIRGSNATMARLERERDEARERFRVLREAVETRRAQADAAARSALSHQADGWHRSWEINHFIHNSCAHILAAHPAQGAEPVANVAAVMDGGRLRIVEPQTLSANARPHPEAPVESATGGEPHRCTDFARNAGPWVCVDCGAPDATTTATPTSSLEMYSDGETVTSFSDHSGEPVAKKPLQLVARKLTDEEIAAMGRDRKAFREASKRQAARARYLEESVTRAEFDALAKRVDELEGR